MKLLKKSLKFQQHHHLLFKNELFVSQLDHPKLLNALFACHHVVTTVNKQEALLVTRANLLLY